MKTKYNENMTRRNVSITRELWERAQRKAGLISMSALIRRLLELYLADKIDLEAGTEK
jgi:hypothetical protein